MGASLVHNLERSAGAFGQRPAVVDGAGAVSYAELWSRVRAVAACLLSRGLRSGERVALVLDNSADFVAAFYGTLLAGGVAVPLNTAARAKDLQNWIVHCGAAWLVHDSDNREAVAAAAQVAAAGVVVVSTRPSVHAKLDCQSIYCASWPAAPELQVCAGTPAAIVYTSGTTGRPKGVQLSHGNLQSNTEAILEYLQLRETDSIVTILPFYYSYGASVLHTHLASGGRLVLERNFVYPHKVVESLVRERATGFAGVPSTFALLLGRVNLDEYDLRSIRYLTQAGGPMPAATAERLKSAFPQAQLYLMYGQTEATARITYLPPSRLAEKRGSVGIAVRGVRIQVRCEPGVAAAPHQLGEIWVHGPNVMLGYWQDPQATHAVLHEGWLKTGDLGYLDGEGYLYVAGRRKDIIKSGAHRIHPADIEEVIAQLQGVAEVAVAGVDDAVLGQAVRAFVVPEPGVTLEAMQVKAHCRARLASYKVPKFVDFVADLPRTPSGKVKRHELQERSLA